MNRNPPVPLMAYSPSGARSAASWRAWARGAPTALGAVASGLLVVLGSAVAAPLPQDRCAALAAELTLLEGGGAAENLARGPEWARQNLTPEQIAYVKRLIVVREHLNFRCRTFAVVRESPSPNSAPEQPASESERKPDATPPTQRASTTGKTEKAPEPDRKLELKEPSASTQSKEAVARPSKEVSQPQRKQSGAESSSDASVTPQAAVEPSQKPKKAEKPSHPKANDAYVPPPGQESTFPRPSLHEQ